MNHSFYTKARDVAGVRWTPFCYDRGGSRDLELRATAGLEVKKSDSFLESLFFNMKARDGTRTRGPNLGKVVLYQLSHSRIYLVSVFLTDTRHIIHIYISLVNSEFYFYEFFYEFMHLQSDQNPVLKMLHQSVHHQYPVLPKVLQHS